MVAVAAAAVERLIEIGYVETDVVDPGAPFFEVSGDWAVWSIRGQQLDVDVSEADGNNLCPISCFGMGRFEAQDVAVEGRCLLKIGNGDTDMGDSGLGFGHRTSE
jgi:hypothetical protein